MPSIFEGDWTTPRPRASAPQRLAPQFARPITASTIKDAINEIINAMNDTAAREIEAAKDAGNIPKQSWTSRDKTRHMKAEKVLDFIAENQPTNGAAILDALGIPEKSMQSYASLLIGEGRIELQNRSETPLGRTDWVLGTYTLKTCNQ